MFCKVNKLTSLQNQLPGFSDLLLLSNPFPQNLEKRSFMFVDETVRSIHQIKLCRFILVKIKEIMFYCMHVNPVSCQNFKKSLGGWGRT